MKRLVMTYVALMLLALASWLVVPPYAAIPIAFVKAGLIGAIFMDLARAHAVPRIAALVALVFLALLCAGVYADIATR
jgi:caa(3)-type oxidase subunit IV